ncbi:winged helix-turn-helix transcriptional regulator [bacterium]|nr:winged helix-turn-helix transcriptional regulator [bacterium]
MQLRQLVSLYKGFSDPTRLRILNLLTQRDQLKVGEIARILQIPQSTVSRQLAQLRASSLIQDERDGTWVKYSIVESPLITEGQLLVTVRMAAEMCPELMEDLKRMSELVPEDENNNPEPITG